MVLILKPAELQIQFPSKCLNYFQFLIFVFCSTGDHVLNVMLIKANKDYCCNHSVWL